MHSSFDFFGGNYVKGIGNTLDNLRLVNTLQNSVSVLFFFFLTLSILWISSDLFSAFTLEKYMGPFFEWYSSIKKIGVFICFCYGSTTLLLIYVVKILSEIRAELSLRINTSQSEQEQIEKFSQINVISSNIEDKFQQSKLIRKYLFSALSFVFGFALLVSL